MCGGLGWADMYKVTSCRGARYRNGSGLPHVCRVRPGLWRNSMFVVLGRYRGIAEIRRLGGEKCGWPFGRDFLGAAAGSRVDEEH